MEPLTGFFILEGILFDVLGAIFIVKGLYPINLTKIDSVIEIKEDFGNNIYHISNLNIKLKKLIHNNGHEDDILKLNNSIEIAKIKLDQFGKAIPTQIRSLEIAAQHERSLDYAIRGLSCLLGGFLLNGIGVVTQLFS